MTLVDAHDTARGGAARFGNTWRVYRLPAWPAAVYGCTAKELPSEADIVGTYPSAEVRAEKADPSPAAEAQGTLF